MSARARRRSHSATSSLDVVSNSWRASTKRAHHHSAGSASPDHPNTPQKWGIDSWRGKRRRRELSSPSNSGQDDIVICDLPHSARSSLPTPTPSFAATSAEFHLFPKNEFSTNRRRSTHHSPASSLDFSTSSESTEMESQQLRSDAFWKLHKSVADDGEGLVRRMRDYEHSRARAETYSKVKDAQKRGRKRLSVHLPVRKSPPSSDESDEDDIQIFSGEVSQVFGGTGRSATAPHLDPRSQSLPGHVRLSSPGPAVSSDDDYLTPNPSLFTPALSQTASESTNSSLVSLSLATPLPTSHPLAASRSEKALAALSLAMANGAGSINDYSNLRPLQRISGLDNYQVGEMWH
ncbi:hypothetical protein C8J56DRAFT_1159130 [Mycena floridula]|nr:hypothetical protein C8J56DRAFT_1159130 [Mycena floridula]